MLPKISLFVILWVIFCNTKYPERKAKLILYKNCNHDKTMVRYVVSAQNMFSSRNFLSKISLLLELYIVIVVTTSHNAKTNYICGEI